jgi:hypothetical protein
MLDKILLLQPIGNRLGPASYPTAGKATHLRPLPQPRPLPPIRPPTRLQTLPNLHSQRMTLLPPVRELHGQSRPSSLRPRRPISASYPSMTQQNPRLVDIGIRLSVSTAVAARAEISKLSTARGSPSSIRRFKLLIRHRIPPSEVQSGTLGQKVLTTSLLGDREGWEDTGDGALGLLTRQTPRDPQRRL